MLLSALLPVDWLSMINFRHYMRLKKRDIAANRTAVVNRTAVKRIPVRDRHIGTCCIDLSVVVTVNSPRVIGFKQVITTCNTRAVEVTKHHDTQI